MLCRLYPLVLVLLLGGCVQKSAYDQVAKAEAQLKSENAALQNQVTQLQTGNAALQNQLAQLLPKLKRSNPYAQRTNKKNRLC